MNLKVTVIQSVLYWEEADKNLEHFSGILKTLDATDIIVLPEMFTTAFTMKPEVLAEEHGGKGLQWMIKCAAEKQCAVTGSISVKEGSHYYNRLYWVEPSGTFLSYDKRHLFSMGKEHEHYTPGNQKQIITYKGWKICPLICYDLRFPVWSRNTPQDPYDLLIYVANWPEVRSTAWKQLLMARAIENQCYVAGVNRIGEDGNSLPHSGDTLVVSPKGEAISNIKPNEQAAETVELCLSDLVEFRDAFPVLNDGDEFTLS